MYEYLKVVAERFRLSSEQSQQPAYISAGIGGASKIIASVATYPYQVVKSKLQQTDILHSDSGEYRAKYSGSWDCATKIWRYVQCWVCVTCYAVHTCALFSEHHLISVLID